MDDEDIERELRRLGSQYTQDPKWQDRVLRRLASEERQPWYVRWWRAVTRGRKRS